MTFEKTESTTTRAIFDKNIQIENFFTKEYIRFLLKIHKDKIAASKIDGEIDNLRIFSKTIAENSWMKTLQEINNKELSCPIHLQIAFVESIEKILRSKITVPDRAIYFRTIILEFERIQNHLFFIATLAKGVSNAILHSKAMKMRNKITGLLDDLVFKNNQHSLITVGGIWNDIDQKSISFIVNELKKLTKVTDKLRKQLRNNIFFKGMLKDAGFLSRDTAKKLALVGPMARSSGITDDIRKNDPYAGYGLVSFSVPVYDSCDLYGELMVRCDEILESLSIIKQLVFTLPEGEIRQDVKNLNVPSGSAIMRVETPEGELFSFALSKKGNLDDKPRMYDIISPMKVNKQGLLARLTGENYENIQVIILSIGSGWGY